MKAISKLKHHHHRVGSDLREREREREREGWESIGDADGVKLAMGIRKTLTWWCLLMPVVKLMGFVVAKV